MRLALELENCVELEPTLQNGEEQGPGLELGLDMARGEEVAPEQESGVGRAPGLENEEMAMWKPGNILLSAQAPAKGVVSGLENGLELRSSYIYWDFKSLLLFTAVFIITADYIKNRRPAGFPPGPWGLPIVGNLFSLDYSRAHESMIQLSEKFGNVFSLRMGQRWKVVLNGIEILKEALVTQGDIVEERPKLPLREERTHGLGVIFSSGLIWKQQRRFALSTLKSFGFGKKSLEPVIVDEFTHCAKDFQNYKGKPFNPHITLNNAVSNIICSLVFGHRFEYGDKKFIKLMQLFAQTIQLQGSIWAQLYNSFPQLMKYLPGPHEIVKKNFNDVKAFIGEEMNEHRKTWDPSDSRDYIDCYLNEIQTNKGQNGSTFSEENLIVCVLDLFVAGSETTSTTLRWAFLYMAKYPEIQEKVQAEIDREIGQSRPPSMEDRAKLPYTDAVIHEVQRMGNIVPLSLPHVTNREVQLGGYTIPKGVEIIPNLTSVLFDKNEWETPRTFNPKHFLSEEGKFVKRAAFIPFSAGKRLCLGENLARMELFLFFTSFMQHFTFSMPAGVKPVLDYDFGITLAPKPYEICAIPPNAVVNKETTLQSFFNRAKPERRQLTHNNNLLHQENLELEEALQDTKKELIRDEVQFENVKSDHKDANCFYRKHIKI
ncbi:cytochrome P450 2J6-like [Pholidichthys leucotaenia]